MHGYNLIQYLELIRKAAMGGITMLQLRQKDVDIEELKDKALLLKKTLKPFKIPLIINDFVELAAEVDADGVHIGQEDMDVEEARRILGPNKIIGLSIESFDDLYHANKQKDISYITASAVFPSCTKPDCKTIWGIDNLRRLVLKSYHPITAIGGINLNNIQEVLNAGVCGIAVVGAIHNARDPYKVAKELNLSTLIKIGI